MIKSKTSNAGPTGLKPKGDYSASATYTLLDCVKYNHDSWVCKAMNAQGEAITITGQAPSASSQYWQALTDGGIAAYNAATSANEAATLANTKAGLADTAATHADTAATHAETAAGAAESAESQALAAAGKASNVNAQLIGYDLKVTDKNGNVSQKNVKGDKGDGIDYSTLTTAQKQELAAMVVRQVTSENILGPQYDSAHRCIAYPTTSGVKYDEDTRSIKIL